MLTSIKLFRPAALLLLLLPYTIGSQTLIGETEVIWANLPNQSLDFGDKVEINSVLFNDFHVNAPADRIVLNDRGASFHTDGSEDVSEYSDWVQSRAELRESPLGVVKYGHTQIYEFEFEVDELPHLTGPVTIFQRFHKGNDGPDLDIELKGDSQWPSDQNLPNGSVLIRPFEGDWVKTHVLLKPKNHLIVAIYSHSHGHYKVSLNGETLAEGSDDTTPDDTYSGPQFGVYNHGDTYAYIGLTHTRYYHAEYDGEIDFNTISSQDFNVVGSSEASFPPKVVVYPNPTTDILNIDSPVLGETVVYDKMGRLVKQSSSKSVNFSDFPQGIYILEWKSGEAIVRRKIIKQ